jgi:hypothetical protein
VPSNAVVRFTFSEPMSDAPTRLDVRFLASEPFGGSLGDWVAQWSPDKRVLTCQPIPCWPTATTIVWSLGTNLVDLALNPLTQDYQGSFRTVDTVSAMLNDAEFRITRSVDYHQLTNSGPVQDAVAPFRFEAVAQLAPNAQPDSVWLELPSLLEVPLSADPLTPGRYTFADASADAGGFGARYASGVYAFGVEALGGRANVLSVVLPSEAPPAPTLTQLSRLETVRSDLPFTLGWLPWSGGTTQDVVRLWFEGTPVGSPEPGQPGALVGTATAWTLPAGILPPGQTYEGVLEFSRLNLETNTQPRYRVSAARLARTRFSLVSVLPPPEPPTLSGASWHPPGTFRMVVTLPQSGSVLIESNTALGSSPWTVLLTTNAAAGSFEFTWSTSTPRGFFRARLP